MQGGYYNNQSPYPMGQPYGQPPPVIVYGPGPVPVQNTPQTVVIKENVNTTSTWEAAVAGCCGACLAVLCCCCLAAASPGPGYHRRGRW